MTEGVSDSEDGATSTAAQSTFGNNPLPAIPPVGAPGASPGHGDSHRSTTPPDQTAGPGPFERERWTAWRDAKLLELYYGNLPWPVIAARMNLRRDQVDARFAALREMQDLPLRGEIPKVAGFPSNEAEMGANIAARGGFQDMPHEPFNLLVAIMNSRRLLAGLPLNFTATSSTAAMCAQGGDRGGEF